MNSFLLAMILIFPSGPFETNAYLVSCDQTKEAVIIDPAPGSAEKIIESVEKEKLLPKAIFLTHSHWDHIADTAKLKKRWNLPVYVHTLDAENLKHPGADKLPLMIPIEGVDPDCFLREEDKLSIGKLIFEVIETPGHTPGGVCFYEPTKKVLFSGDTLFKGTIGNLSFPTSEPEKMWHSLKKLATLPGETKVYPGHGEVTTIGDEGWLVQAKQIFGY